MRYSSLSIIVIDETSSNMCIIYKVEKVIAKLMVFLLIFDVPILELNCMHK